MVERQKNIHPDGTDTLVTPRERRGRRAAGLLGRDVLELSASTSQLTNYIYQNTSDAGSDHWPSNVSNSTGWTVEYRAMSPTQSLNTNGKTVFLGGSSELVLDDGTQRVELLLSGAGVYQRTMEGVQPGARLLLATQQHSEFAKVRIAGKDDNFYLLSESGQAYVGTSAFTSDSTGAELQIGHRGTTSGILLLDYFHQSHMGIALDVEDDIDYVVSTDEFTSTTPSLQHERNTNGYVSAIIESIPPYTGSTTKIQTQYNNDNVGAWTDFGAAVTLTDGLQVIDLSTVPVENDGSDALRFRVLQKADSGTDRAAPVTSISVLTKFAPTQLSVSPEYGSRHGGNTVTLSSDGSVVMNATDLLFVQGKQVPEADITHVSSTEKTFIVPPGFAFRSRGDAKVRLQDASTSSYFTDRPYKYLRDYDHGVDRFERIAEVCGTRSAFRMKNEVPEGEVNLAYISGPGIDVDSHVGLIDLSYLESGNIVSGIGTPELLTDAAIETSDATAGTFSYSAPPSTEEIAVAGTCAAWRELNVPSPLFYKHLIGKGRYYFKVDQTTLNLEELRDSITVHLQDGTPLLLEDYGWDIAISTLDVDGDTLPTQIYSVILMTNKKFIPGKTVFMTSTVVDRANKFRLVQGYTEVINPEPIVKQGGTTQGFDVVVAVDGSFQLDIRP